MNKILKVVGALLCLLLVIGILWLNRYKYFQNGSSLFRMNRITQKVEHWSFQDRDWK